jgi:hypothetical protein
MLSDGASPTAPMLNMPIEIDAFYDRFFNPPSSIRGEEGLEKTIVSPNADTEAVLFAQLGLMPAKRRKDPTLLQNIFFYLSDPNDKSLQRGNLPSRANFYSTAGVYNPNAPTVYVPLTPELLGSGATYQFQLDPQVDLEHRQITIGIQKPISGTTQVAMQVTNQATGEVSTLPALRKIPYEVRITPVLPLGYVYTPEGARYIQLPFEPIDTQITLNTKGLNSRTGYLIPGNSGNATRNENDSELNSGNNHVNAYSFRNTSNSGSGFGFNRNIKITPLASEADDFPWPLKLIGGILGALGSAWSWVSNQLSPPTAFSTPPTAPMYSQKEQPTPKPNKKDDNEDNPSSDWDKPSQKKKPKNQPENPPNTDQHQNDEGSKDRHGGGKKRQFRFEVQRSLKCVCRILHGEFDSQGIFGVDD